MSADYFAPALGMLWKILLHYEHNPAPLFAQYGLTHQQIANPEMRIPNVVIQQLWTQADAIIGDPALSLRAAEYVHPSHLGSLGYAWLASNSLRNALTRLNRYIRLLTGEREISVLQNGIEVHIETRMEKSAQELPVRTDVAMAVLMTMCRWNYGSTLQPIRVLMQRERNTSHQDLEEFFGSTLHYCAPANVLVLHADQVDRRFVSSNPVLAQMTEQYLQDYLKRLDQDDLITRIKQVIADHILEAPLPIEEVAQLLIMSVRTLQRRLKDLQSSYKQLIDETRFEIAQTLLHDERNSLIDVAFNTGFSSQSSFTNAVKRWTGLSPREYRQKLQTSG